MKVLIAVGGWTMSYRFSEAFMNATNRTAFVNSCVSLVNTLGADGIDLDWEYPTTLGAGNCPSGHTCARTADAANLTAGLDQFRAHAGFAGKLLTAAIAANGPTSMYQYASFFGGTPARFDWVNVMTYDFHGGWETATNFTAPYGEATAAMNFVLGAGVGAGNKHRVVMGIPFYGPAWYNVASPGNPGTSGTFLGSVSYRKAKATFLEGDPDCKLVTTGNNRHIYCGGAVTFSMNGSTITRSNIWISYEDPFVVGAKGDFVATNDWGGMMWWSQGEDSAANDLVNIIDSKLTPSAPQEAPPAPTGLVATAGNAQVSLTWNAAAGATSYTVKRSTTSGSGYMNAGTSGSTGLTDTSVSNGTTYYYVVTASNAAGESPSSNEASATPMGPPPSPWTSQDIGAVGMGGSFSDAAGVLTLEGSGADVYGTADEFRFAHRSVTGDVTITARVASLENTNAWAKAGVMMRDGTAAGARNLFMLLSPTATNKYRYQARTTAGGSTSSVASSGSSAIPAWVRLQRVGDTFKGFFSTNGSTWTQVGTTTTVDLPDTILVGVATTSHNDATLATAVFDGLVVAGPGPTPPPAPTNLAATAGNAAVSLTWNPAAGAASYTLKRGTTAGGPYVTTFAGLTATSFPDTTVANGTTYYYVVTAVNGVGSSGNSNQVSATPSAPSTWLSADVGAVGVPGTYTQGAGTHTLEGSGADVWGNADEFRFAYQDVTGDTTITARLVSLENTDPFAKGGVMMRNGTGANAVNAFMLITPTAANGYRFQRRTAASGTTTRDTGGTSTTPTWVRLRRAGNNFTAFYSSNGTSWTQLGGAVAITAMPSSFKVGLAVTSHNDTVLSTAVFDSVTVTKP